MPYVISIPPTPRTPLRLSRAWQHVAFIALAGGALALPATAQDAQPADDADLLQRIEQLERAQAESLELNAALFDELEEMRGQAAGMLVPGTPSESSAEGGSLTLRPGGITGRLPFSQGRTGFAFGGYGETHFNFKEGSGGDLADIHRLVFFMGYKFSERIKLYSETEIEHGFVSDGNGDVVIEQLYSDILFEPGFNLRVGRVLAPLGIVNQWHEPPTFNGVERPSVEVKIIPTTWSLDGVGAFGRFGEDAFSWQLYLTGGLDGSGFDGTNGIRGGRIKERPSLNDPALSGRLDWFPLANNQSAGDQSLRLGGSFFHGGVDNGNKGKDPGLDGDVTILSADFQYTRGSWDFRGVGALASIDNADGLNTALVDENGADPGIADELQGYYLEAAYHVMPDSWRTGLLEDGDLVLFTRYEDYDTQAELPGNATPTGAAARDEVTVGMGLYLTRNFVVKLDYQFKDDDTSDGALDQFNLGVGFQF